MLQNDYLVAKIGVDTAENEPRIASDVSLGSLSLGQPAELRAPVAEPVLEACVVELGVQDVVVSQHLRRTVPPCLRLRPRVEKFDGPAIEPIELLNIRIRVEILSEFRKFCQNSSEIQKFEDLSTFSKLFIEILRNSH